MVHYLCNILLFSAGAVSAVVSGADYDGDAAPRAHQLDESYTFDQYLAHHDKSYDDADEYDRRSQIFARNMKKILRHNEGKITEDGDVIKGYVMGVNMFTDVEVEELPMGYNKLHHPAWRSQLVGGAVLKTERLLGGTETYSRPPDFQMDDVSSLPKEMDWSAEGKVNPTIPQQGGCGSCWTFAATAAMESHLAIATGEEPVTLSEQSILQCAPNPDDCGGQGDCTGSTPELAFNYVADQTTKKKGGMYNINDVPYDSDKRDWDKCEAVTKGKSASVGIKAYTQLPANDYQSVMNAVAKVGPLAIAVAADQFSMYEKGVFGDNPDEAAATTINHAVLLVGYGVDKDTGEKFYKIRNSWGEKFGEEGYIRIKRTDDDDHLCLTDNDPLKGIACALDDQGNKVDVKPAKICGTAGILFDTSYPQGVHKID